MRAKANSMHSKRIAGISIAGFILLGSVGAIFAQGTGATERELQLEINREGAETRIERLHEDRARGQAPEMKKNKKSRKTTKRPRQWLQY